MRFERDHETVPRHLRGLTSPARLRLAIRMSRFRFTLQRGKLYAVRISPDASGASHGFVAAGGPGFTGQRTR